MTKSASTNKAREETAKRLRDAFSELTRQNNFDSRRKVVTVTAVCERAGISRNAVYRYHRDVLCELQEWQRKHCSPAQVDEGSVTALREERDELRTQIGQLAALVDHYYAAWTETKALLKRRDSELAALRKASKLTSISARHDAGPNT